MCTSTVRPERERGQNAVEFALLLPLLMLVVFGVLDLGRVFFAAITIANAARAGARYAAQHPSDPNGAIAIAQAEAQGQGINLADPTTSSVTVSCPQGCASAQPIQVTVSYSVTLVMGFVLPSPVQVSNTVEMQVQ